MSCAGGRELMLDPSHVASCRECRARELLQTFEPDAMSGVERSRLWAKIDSGRRASPSPWARLFEPRWVAVFAAAAVVIFFVVTRVGPEKETFEREAWVEVASGSAIPIANAVIRVEAPGKVWMEPEELGRELRVFRGVIEIDDAIAEVFVPKLGVETPRARIVALGAKYRVEVDRDATRVAVARGEVEVTEGDDKVIVKAGERYETKRPAKQAAKPEQPEQLAQPAAPVERASEPPPVAVRVVKPKSLPPPAEASPIETASVRAEIAAARSLIGTDDVRAADIADRVLAEKPRAEEEVEALMIAADARRRSKRLAEASERYARVIDHPRGAAFAEEAVSRRAGVLTELGKNDEALALLRASKPRFARGSLVPERLALEARLLLARGDELAAADLLEHAGNDRVLDSVRAELARALESRDPARAKRLRDSINSR